MTKQIARNPMVVALALQPGLNKTVCVDIQCARLLHRYRMPIGHVGHLNQLPRDGVAQALRMHPTSSRSSASKRRRWSTTRRKVSVCVRSC